MALPLGLLLCYHGFMGKQTTMIAKKRRGPIPTGKGQQIVVRMQPAPLADLDRWIKGQIEPDLSRPEAIRRLVEIGLKAKGAKP